MMKRLKSQPVPLPFVVYLLLFVVFFGVHSRPLYIARSGQESVKAMHVIESDDLTIARKLQGKISYSESFANYCKLAFVAFLIITVGANALVQEFPGSASINLYPVEAYGIFLTLTMRFTRIWLKLVWTSRLSHQTRASI